MSAHAKMRGAVLPAALIIITALGLTASAVVRSARHGAVAAAYDVRTAQLDHAIDAGVARSIYALQTSDAEKAVRPGGAPYGFSFAGTNLVVAVSAEVGKLDLNAAPPTALAGLIEILRADHESALSTVDSAAFAEAVAARRAAVAGSDEPAFSTRSDLVTRALLSEAAFRVVAPFVTTVSFRQQVSIAHAPAAVLAALPGARLNDVARIIDARDRGQSYEIASAPASMRPFLVAGDGEFFRIDVTARNAAATQLVRRKSVLVWASTDRPATIVESTMAFDDVAGLN